MDLALASLHPWILLIDHKYPAAAADHLSTGHLFQRPDRIPNFHSFSPRFH